MITSYTAHAPRPGSINDLVRVMPAGARNAVREWEPTSVVDPGIFDYLLDKGLIVLGSRGASAGLWCLSELGRDVRGRLRKRFDGFI